MNRIDKFEDWLLNKTSFALINYIEVILLIATIFILMKPGTKTDCTKLYKIASSTEVIVFLQENCK